MFWEVGDLGEVTRKSQGLGDWMVSLATKVDSAGRIDEEQRGMCLI